MIFIITWGVFLYVARVQWSTENNVFSSWNWGKICSTFLYYLNVIRACGLLAGRPELLAALSYRLLQVSRKGRRKHESYEWIQENEIGNETFSMTYFCNRTTNCCYCHLLRKYTPGVSSLHKEKIPSDTWRRQNVAEVHSEIWSTFGNLTKNIPQTSYFPSVSFLGVVDTQSLKHF